MNLSVIGFNFNGHSLSDFEKYSLVYFDAENSEDSLFLSRSVERGEKNRYRSEPNEYGCKNDNYINIRIQIMKDVCTLSDQNDLSFSTEEVREITRWLTSTSLSQWLTCTYDNESEEKIRYKGQFTDIETYWVGTQIMGLTLVFECSSEYGYTEDKEKEVSANGYQYTLIENNSDKLDFYEFPTITISPKESTDILIINQSDSEVVKTDSLNALSIDELIQRAAEYALYNQMDIIYEYDTEGEVVSLCDQTAIRFKGKKRDGTYENYIAYFEPSKVYTIRKGGYMSFSALSNNAIYIDCQSLTIDDSLGRMIQYKDLGINDVGNIYWLKLINGNNSILCYGKNTNFKFSHTEARKVGAIQW